MPITRNFTLYLNAGISVAPTVHVNQYDRGEQWVFTLLDDKGQKYTPSSGALIGVKADGNAIAGVTGTVGSNGDVYITETQQMTAAAGKAIFELTIDGQTHGTANFIVQVEKKPTDDAVLSESDLSIIQQGIDSVTPAAINETVSEYLAEHMTNPPIDPTLTVSNAAADAKVTGDNITDLKNAFDQAITTHKNHLENAEYYDGYYWKRTAPLGRSSSSNHNAYYGIPVEGGKTYYYRHIFLYYTVVVYDGETTPATLTTDTSQDVTGTFIPDSDGIIYISVNKAYTPLFTDDEELYNSNTFETYYTPNKLIVTKTEEDLSFTLTNGKAILNVTGSETTANQYWNASNYVDISQYSKIKLFSAFQNTLAGAFYDENQNFIVGITQDSAHSATAYEYNLITPPNAKYVRFTVYTYRSGVDTYTAYVKGVIETIQEINADVKSLNDAISEPLTKMPPYMLGLMSYRQIGNLEKGYICMTCDDGSAGLATYTIPMLTQKQVPATFGLFATSDVITNTSYLQTLLTAIQNGNAVAMHGVASWSTLTEYYLNKYFEDTEAALSQKGITEIAGAICPGVSGYDDTSELIRSVAGGRYGSVCSGGTHGEISYGSYYCAGNRTNIYAIRRNSIIRLTEAQYKAAIDYAYDNNMIFMPFWHDYDIVNNAEYQTIIEGMIDYAKTKGLTFITMKDLPTIK